MSEILTPAKVEKDLRDFLDEWDEAHATHKEYASSFSRFKFAFDMAMARARKDRVGAKLNADEKYADCLIACEKEYLDFLKAEIGYKASRENIDRLKIRSDVLRTQSASVRESMK